MVKKCALSLLILIAALSLMVHCEQNEVPEPKPDNNARAPIIDFTLTGIDGMDYTLSAQKGTVVLVDFWATWCPPCLKEIPHLKDLYEQYKDQGFAVWGVSLGDEEGKLNAFVDEYAIGYPILLGTQNIGQQYGVQGIPTTLLIDKQNRIAFKHVGFSPGMEEQFSKEIEQLLAE